MPPSSQRRTPVPRTPDVLPNFLPASNNSEAVPPKNPRAKTTNSNSKSTSNNLSSEDDSDEAELPHKPVKDVSNVIYTLS